MQVEGHMAHGKLHDPTTLLLFHLLFLGALTHVPREEHVPVFRRGAVQHGAVVAELFPSQAVQLGRFLRQGTASKKKK